MGTWEEESRELIESENEISKVVSSDETHNDVNEGDVHVEVGVVDVNGESEGNGGRDHDVDALVQQLERAGFDNSQIEQGVYEEGGVEGGNPIFPLRPYAEDCSFYVRTGSCKFGENCRYNHPPKGEIQDTGYTVKGIERNDGSMADAGKTECKYFQTPGGCKYGNACRYNHSSHQIQKDYQGLNRVGLPIRPSEQKCTFYLRNGSCGYGVNCRFNHPDSSTKEFETGNSLAYENSVRSGMSLPRNYAGEPLQSFSGVSQGTQELPNGLNMRNPSPYVPDLSYYHSMRPNPGWNQTQAISAFQANKFPLPHQLSKGVDQSTHYGNLMQIEEFPERPGQPDCDYFMKTGSCKYGSACRFNHPRSRASKLQPAVSSKGLYSSPATMPPVETSEYLRPNSNNLRNNRHTSSHQHHQQQMQNEDFPERPGQPECEYYMKTGQCKFKSACKYHHPKSRAPTPSQYSLSEKGLPLRPGAKLCRNYEQQGMCKYGVNCLFNHPNDPSPAPPVVPNSEPLPTNTVVNSAWDDDWGM